MKIVNYLFGLVYFFACSTMAGPIILKEGETYTYEFDSLPFVKAGEYWSSYVWEHSVELFWDVKSLKKGTQLQVSIFEDSISDIPVIENVWTSPQINGGFTLVDTWFGMSVWEDFQGAFSFTVLSGSLMFNSFELSVLDTIDSEHVNIHGVKGSPPLVSVPEPGSVGLLVIFAVGLCIIARTGRSVMSKFGDDYLIAT
jgi:hypothetical protein